MRGVRARARAKKKKKGRPIARGSRTVAAGDDHHSRRLRDLGVGGAAREFDGKLQADTWPVRTTHRDWHFKLLARFLAYTRVRYCLAGL